MAIIQNPYFLGAAVSRNTRPVTFPDHLPYTGHRWWIRATPKIGTAVSI